MMSQSLFSLAAQSPDDFQLSLGNPGPDSQDSGTFIGRELLKDPRADYFQQESTNLIGQYPNAYSLTNLESLQLPVVLALAMLAAAASMCWKHWRETRHGTGAAHRSLEVLETISLGTRGTLILVACAEAQALVACDAQGIRSVAVLPSPFPTHLMEQDDVLPAVPTTGISTNDCQLSTSPDLRSLRSGLGSLNQLS